MNFSPCFPASSANRIVVCLALLLSPLATRADIEFSFQATSIHTSTNDFWAGGYIYFGSPFLQADSNSAPLTYHWAFGPNTNHHATLASNSSGSSSGFHLSLSNMLDGVTNGNWTLILNVGHPSATTNFFRVQAVGVTSNTFAPVQVFAPADGATNVLSPPPTHWIGPSNTALVGVDMHAVDFSFFATDLLPAAATNWPAAPNVAGGTNVFKVRFYTNAIAFWSISTPTNQTNGQPLSNWIAFATNASQQEAWFSVGRPVTGDPETNALWAHLKFDNTNDLRLDSSPNGNHADGTFWFGAGPPVYTNAGITNGGLFLDGSNGLYFSTNVAQGLNGDFSVSLWVKTTQSSGSESDDGRFNAGIFSAKAFVDGEDTIPMALTGDKLAFYTGSPHHAVHSISNINAGTFVHLVVTRELASGLKKIYVNGALDSTGYGTINPLVNNTNLDLGNSEYSGQGLKGTVDDLQVYKGVLSPSQVRFIYTHPGEPANAQIPLAVALDTTNLAWTTGGEAKWFGQTAINFDTADAAQADATPNDGSAYLQTTVTGPGKLSFQWRVSSEDGYDFLQFRVDGNTINQITGESGWQLVTNFAVAAGAHALRWQYAKDVDAASGLDAGWVDNVVFTPDVPSPVSFFSLANTGGDFQFSFVTQSNWTHAVDYRDSMQTGAWLLLTAFVGNGSVTNFIQPSLALPRRFYQVRTY